MRKLVMKNRNVIKILSCGLVSLTLTFTSCGGDGGGGASMGSSGASSTKGGSVVIRSTPVLMAVNISPSNLLGIQPGAHLLFTAKGYYSDNSVQDVTTIAVWTSSDTSIATVSNAGDSKGWATAVSKGYCSISATVEGASGSTIIGVH
jgi:hypothetical protein